ncbi:Glutamate decarboxylase [Marinibacterium anthonyi]|nr:Glutamate decarboxylase [Marinibacterium anthonyi]
MTDRTPFPATGRSWSDLQAEIRDRSAGDLAWKDGRSPVFVFRNDQKTYEVGRDAYFECFSENALGRARAFFGIGSMEKDVLDFGLDLFNAPESGAGAFTSGGSESIFIAMKAARDAVRARTGLGRGEPLNLVVPITVHPAFDKAADAMDLDMRRAPLRADRRVDVAAMAGLIDDHTVAIVGSAPCFPHGVIDPIDELSALALDAGVWLHVDACVGGWIAPFFTRNGRPTPDFDFRFGGVRSISADLHKFGFCPKPASTVFYRDGADLDRATFTADAWPSGRFSTATLAGTRPGGAVAGAWAVLNHLGTDGYLDAARRLADMVDRYCAGIEAIEGLELWARPDVSIINYGAQTLNILAVAERMHGLGWLPGLTKAPRGMHAMLSMLHDGQAREDYLRDLRTCVEDVRKDPMQTSSLEAVY